MENGKGCTIDWKQRQWDSAASMLFQKGNTIKHAISLLYPLETAAGDTIGQNVEGKCQK